MEITFLGERRNEENIFYINNCSCFYFAVFNKIMSKLLKFGKDLEPPETSNLFFIISAMTEWYKDSANAYIPFAKMFHIAKEKLKGMPTEKLLEEEIRKPY